MSTESRIDIDTIEIDTREVALKLSFLVGKTVLLRASDGSSCATTIDSIRVFANPVPMVDIYYNGLGLQHITKTEKFWDIMLLDENGNLESLGEIVDRLGIYF